MLRFASEHPLSLLRDGAGYWRYVPVGDGRVRFLTGYDYRVRWGRLGRLADLVFRPLIGWGTAWSFDRLRLWVDHGVAPERSLHAAVADVGARLTAVALAGRAGRWPAALVAAAALLLPPAPRTPTARRCLRRPPDARSGTAPETLDSLERPC